MVITTTESVTGYRIKEYLGLVFGSDIYLVGGLMGGGMGNQENLFGYAFAKAQEHLIEKAKAMGADAIVGIKQSYTSPGSLNNMVLILTGTAVKLEDDSKKDEFEDDVLPDL